MIHIDTFSSGLDDLPPAKRKSSKDVLEILHKQEKFSVFEAPQFDDLARTLDAIHSEGLIERTERTGGQCPWIAAISTTYGR